VEALMIGPCRTDLLPAEKGAGVSLWYVAMRLGLTGRSAQWLLNHIRQLVANHGFPPPFPHFMLDGRKRDGITLASRWLREAADAWFDGFLPPALAEAAEAARLARDAETLDQRAKALAA
jgi:hypothetical protein